MKRITGNIKCNSKGNESTFGSYNVPQLNQHQ